MVRENFAGVVVERDGSVLLVQEGHEEACGLWSFPLGHCEPDELPETAAAREMNEETGLAAHVGALLAELVLDNGEFKSTAAFNNTEIHLYLYKAQVDDRPVLHGKGVLAVKWIDRHDVSNIPLRGEWMRRFI